MEVIEEMVSVSIIYCEHCNYIPRALQLMKGLQEAFKDDVEVALEPGSTGIFDVYVGDEVVFSKYKELRFPTLDEIKAIVEDKIATVQTEI